MIYQVLSCQSLVPIFPTEADRTTEQRLKGKDWALTIFWKCHCCLPPDHSWMLQREHQYHQSVLVHHRSCKVWFCIERDHKWPTEVSTETSAHLLLQSGQRCFLWKEYDINLDNKLFLEACLSDSYLYSIWQAILSGIEYHSDENRPLLRSHFPGTERDFSTFSFSLALEAAQVGWGPQLERGRFQEEHYHY